MLRIASLLHPRTSGGLLAGLFVTAALGSPALASPRDEPLPRVVFVEEDRAAGTREYQKIRRFGNRNRIRKLTEARAESPRVYVLVRDPEADREYEHIRRFGNRHKIARLIDASVIDLEGRVVVQKDIYGLREMVALKRFGNKNRIEKRLGARR